MHPSRSSTDNGIFTLHFLKKHRYRLLLEEEQREGGDYGCFVVNSDRTAPSRYRRDKHWATEGDNEGDKREIVRRFEDSEHLIKKKKKSYHIFETPFFFYFFLHLLLIYRSSFSSEQLDFDSFHSFPSNFRGGPKEYFPVYWGFAFAEWTKARKRENEASRYDVGWPKVGVIAASVTLENYVMDQSVFDVPVASIVASSLTH